MLFSSELVLLVCALRKVCCSLTLWSDVLHHASHCAIQYVPESKEHLDERPQCNSDSQHSVVFNHARNRSVGHLVPVSNSTP